MRRQPLSKVVRGWQEATGDGSLNRLQVRELLKALEAQEGAVRALVAHFPDDDSADA